MIWVWVFGVVALVGLITAVSYAVWLAHKVSDLFSEFRMLGRRASEAAELLASVELSGNPPSRLD